MRLLLTADLHYNHPRSRAVAEELIDQINQQGADVLVLVGDTAVADGDALERCLSRFKFAGPKLFVAGNHELWTHGDDSYSLFKEQWPKRVRELGWHWLEDDPFMIGASAAIVGSVGWYDYSFARPELEIPQRFYASKVSPGAAERFSEFVPLFEPSDDISPAAKEVVARWNDGRFVKLHRTDEAFLNELLTSLRRQLEQLTSMRQIVACIHHVPFKELLPPPHSAQWDFAKAFLGSARIGELMLEFANVKYLFCGHSHLPSRAILGHIGAINIGSGYRHKTFKVLDVDG